MNVQTAIKILGLLALIAGLGVALSGLIAPMGVWLNFWDFRQGFTILRNTHGVALWIIIAVAVIGVVVTACSVKFPRQHFVRLGIFILVAAGLGSLSYLIPETFRAPDGHQYPPIHDISTDTVNPPHYVAVLPLRANAANTLEYGKSEGMTPETLANLQQQAYPDIQPWRTQTSKEDVFAKALQVVEQLGWELVDQNLAEGRIEATDTTFWFRFKDDVVIYISEANGETLVNARSVSRVGRGDVGANAKRIRAFFAALKT